MRRVRGPPLELRRKIARRTDCDQSKWGQYRITGVELDDRTHEALVGADGREAPLMPADAPRARRASERGGERPRRRSRSARGRRQRVVLPLVARAFVATARRQCAARRGASAEARASRRIRRRAPPPPPNPPIYRDPTSSWLQPHELARDTPCTAWNAYGQPLSVRARPVLRQYLF